VSDEVLARLALLIGVALAGEGEGVLDRAPVDPPVLTVGAVLADDREQVAEQGAVAGAQVARQLVDRRGRTVSAVGGPDPGVPAPVRGPRGSVMRFELL
jgi:hypothetical protein